MVQTYEGPGIRHVSRFRLAEMQGNQPADGASSLLDFAPLLRQEQQPPSPAPEQAPQRRQAAPRIDGVNLLFDDGPDATVQQAQTAAPPAINGEDLLFGSNAHEPALSRPDPMYAEPDAPTWWGRRKQDINGRRDVRESNTGTVFDQFKDDMNLKDPIALAAVSGASDAQLADILQKQLGDRFIRREQDANGYDVFVTRGRDGQEQRGYVNAPGLDSMDVSRGILGAAPYVAGGAAIGTAAKGTGALVRTIAQTFGAGGTSIAGDLAQIPQGSQQGIEGTKAAIAAGFGAGGALLEAAGGRLWQRYVTEPRLFNRSTGQLTQEGADLARAQGLDPAAMQDEIAKVFAQTYAKTRDASQAAIKAQESEFGIPSTAGQRSKIPDQLTEEEAMRRNLYGEKARDTMLAFDKRQAEAVDFAARTRMPSDFRSQAVAPGGTMNPAGITNVQQMGSAADLGEGIGTGLRNARSAAKKAESDAWDEVTDILPTKESFDRLPDALSGRLGGMRVTNDMPKASAMAKAIDAYTKGKAFADPVADVLKQTPVKTVDEMRRQLLGMYKGAQDPTDAAAAKAIYDGFNDWIDDAAEKALLAGSPEAATKLRIARDSTRVMQSLFSPQIRGQKTAAARIISKVLDNADTPERTVDVLFGAPSASVKEGTVEALKAIKGALNRYADKRIAGDTIADLKIAYWSKLVQSKQGAPHTPGVMLGNIRAALNNQRSVVQELYTPAEIAQIRRLETELARITYRDPNPSGSGYTAAALAKQFFGKLLDLVPWAREALEYTGVPSTVNAVSARRAVEQQVRRTPQNWAPVTTPAGATYGRDNRSPPPALDTQRYIDVLQQGR